MGKPKFHVGQKVIVRDAYEVEVETTIKMVFRGSKLTPFAYTTTTFGIGKIREQAITAAEQ